jgi:hypothetical protein
VVKAMMTAKVRIVPTRAATMMMMAENNDYDNRKGGQSVIH